MIKSSNFLLLGLAVVLGIFLVRQARVQQEVERLVRQAESPLIALEIAELVSANGRLRAEINKLASEREKSEKALAERRDLAGELAETIQTFEVIAGTREVEGPGILVRLSGAVLPHHLIDLVNALKNIGAEALAINGERLTERTGLSQKLPGTFEILATGNPVILESALERKGGLTEQITRTTKDIRVEIERSENLRLRATPPRPFRASRIIKD